MAKDNRTGRESQPRTKASKGKRRGKDPEAAVGDLFEVEACQNTTPPNNFKWPKKRKGRSASNTPTQDSLFDLHQR